MLGEGGGEALCRVKAECVTGRPDNRVNEDLFVPAQIDFRMPVLLVLRKDENDNKGRAGIDEWMMCICYGCDGTE